AFAGSLDRRRFQVGQRGLTHRHGLLLVVGRGADLRRQDDLVFFIHHHLGVVAIVEPLVAHLHDLRLGVREVGLVRVLGLLGDRLGGPAAGWLPLGASLSPLRLVLRRALRPPPPPFPRLPPGPFPPTAAGPPRWPATALAVASVARAVRRRAARPRPHPARHRLARPAGAGPPPPRGGARLPSSYSRSSWPCAARHWLGPWSRRPTGCPA